MKKLFFTRSQNINYSKTSDSYNKSVLESKSSTSPQSSPQGGSKSGPGRFEGSRIGSLPNCSYYKRKSHLINECFKLKRKMTGQTTTTCLCSS